MNKKSYVKAKDKKISRRNFLKKTAVASGVALISASTGPFVLKTLAKGPIKVGLLTPLSGVVSTDGTGMLYGTKLWEKEINESGGLLGREVKLLVEDTESETKISREKAKRLLAKRVDVIFGVILSSTRNALASVIRDAGKLLIYPTFYEGGVCDKSIFFTGAVPAQAVDRYVPWIIEKYGPKFYYAGSDYVFPKKMFERAKEVMVKHGGTAVKEEYVALGTTEFSSLINRISAAKPDVLFESVVGRDGVTFSKQFYNYGLANIIQQCSIVKLETHMEGVGAEAGEGILTSHPYFQVIDTPKNKKFVADFQKIAGKKFPLTTNTEGMYIGAHLWALAVKKAKSTETDKVRTAMWDLEWEAPEGPVKVRKGDQHLWKQSRIAQYRNGKLEIVKSFGLIPPGPDICHLWG